MLTTGWWTAIITDWMKLNDLMNSNQWNWINLLLAVSLFIGWFHFRFGARNELTQPWTKLKPQQARRNAAFNNSLNWIQVGWIQNKLSWFAAMVSNAVRWVLSASSWIGFDECGQQTSMNWSWLPFDSANLNQIKPNFIQCVTTAKRLINSN